jgi:hypothetical protein
MIYARGSHAAKGKMYVNSPMLLKNPVAQCTGIQKRGIIGQRTSVINARKSVNPIPQ